MLVWVRRLPVCLLWAFCLAKLQGLGAAPYGIDARVPIGPFLDNKLPSAAPGSGGGWKTVKAFPNLTFEDPVFLTFGPNSNLLYVCGRQGIIHFFVNDPSTSSKTVFLDIRSRTQGYHDCGLMGMAFHPDYGKADSTNRGYFYVCYQYSATPINSTPPSTTPTYNRLSRFNVPDGSIAADPNSELVLVNQYDENVWHNGGAMFFGADGFLYFTNGDEGGSNDQYNNTQTINSGLFSGVFRIDVNQDPSKSHPIRRQPLSGSGLPPSFSANYYIPNDNPFLDPNGGVLEEFWCIGLRSPHRMSFDPVTKLIWLGDVGQGAREEIDLIEKGGNYQWAYREGLINGPKVKPATIIGTEKPPIYEYSRINGDNCVIGGYVYRGTTHAPALTGKYIFGDNGSGRIWAMDYNGVDSPGVTYLCNMPAGFNFTGLSSFGLDQNNEIYMCQMGSAGQIWKLAQTGAQTPQPPALLSQTGVFSDLASLTPASGLIPYGVNVPLWSDNASKSRWIGVPNDGAPYSTSEQVAFSPTGEWLFPNGTVFIKHFELPVNETNPSLKKRLETRLLVRDTNSSVYGVTYKWRADNSDADLLLDSLTEDIAVTTATGTRAQTWYYPSRQDCLMCHNATANFVLGVKAPQLNGDFDYAGSGITDNQLRTWNHLSLFQPAIAESDIPGYAKMVSLNDSSASLADRVRSYLDANCAQCHRPNGVDADFDTRFDVSLLDQQIVAGIPHNTLGIAGAKTIVPGEVSKSMIYERMTRLDDFKMPPLARNLIDSQALSVMAEWINSLALLPPWVSQDIGNVGIAGDAYVSGDLLITLGSGIDVWDSADGFHFTSQSRSGDGQILARIASVGDTDPWAAAGVMVRENMTPGARNVFLGVTSGHGIEFQSRLATGDITHFIAGDSVSAPYWLKLARAGDLFTAYSSIDGLNWAIAGSYTNSMSADASIGLAVTARNNTLLNTSAFSDVQITIASPANAPPTISDISNHSTVANTPTTAIAFKIGDNETPAEDLNVAGYSSNSALVPPGAFSFGGQGVDRIAIITPAPNQWGSATITVTVTDGNGASASDSFLLTVLADTDGDGMPDVWELANGLSPSWSGDASIDSDGDGFTNLEEFLAGTDPHNPAEFPVIIETQDIDNNDVQVKFRTVIDRTYRVERSDTFPSLNWTVVTDGISGTGGIVQITDVGGANHPKSFYRVAVSP